MMVNNVIPEFPGGLKWEGVGGGGWKWKVFNVEGIIISWINKKLRDGQGQKENENRPEG